MLILVGTRRLQQQQRIKRGFQSRHGFLFSHSSLLGGLSGLQLGSPHSGDEGRERDFSQQTLWVIVVAIAAVVVVASVTNCSSATSRTNKDDCNPREKLYTSSSFAVLVEKVL
jgi:heme/copper-type cytochrome/quinol oxidase subunit 2